MVLSVVGLMLPVAEGTKSWIPTSKVMRSQHAQGARLKLENRFSRRVVQFAKHLCGTLIFVDSFHDRIGAAKLG